MTQLAPTQEKTTYQHTNIRLTAGKLEEPSEDREQDIKNLIQECLLPLHDASHKLEPKFFVLWLTQEFKPDSDLISRLHQGIQSEVRKFMIQARLSSILENEGLKSSEEKTDSTAVQVDEDLKKCPVHLLGATVSACVFDQEIHPRGAVLICFAAQELGIEVAVEVVEALSYHPKDAVYNLLKNLDLVDIDRRRDFNPRRDRIVVTFLPGYDGDDPGRYRAAEIVHEMREQTYGRIYFFGGVACGSQMEYKGAQILDDKIYGNSIVAARLTIPSRYAIGLSQGLSETNHEVTVGNIDPQTRAVQELTLEGQIGQDFAKEFSGIANFMNGDSAIRKWNYLKQRLGENIPVFLGRQTPEGDRIIYPIREHQGRLKFIRNIEPSAKLRAVRPVADDLFKDNLARREWMQVRFGILPNKVIGILSIGCVGRLDYRAHFSYDPKKSIDKVAEEFDRAEHIGCFMRGEVGIAKTGRTIFANMSVSDLFLCDDISERLLSHRFSSAVVQGLPTGAERAMDGLPAAIEAQDHLGAANACLKFIQRLGYPGGMISLSYWDGNQEVIVARAGAGRLWSKVVKITKRPLHCGDILAMVARSGNSQFIPDSDDDTANCDRIAVREGDIMSQYICPLFHDYMMHQKKNGGLQNTNSKDSPITGTLQIDLGDRRDEREIPLWEQATLEWVRKLVNLFFNRALKLEQDVLCDQLSLAEATFEKNCSSEHEAARSMAIEAQQKSGADFVHIRLWSNLTKRLKMIGGHGPYYELAKDVRKDLDPHAPAGKESPSVYCAKHADRLIINDAQKDDRAQKIREEYANTTLGVVLNKINSFANYSIGKEGGNVWGVVSFGSKDAWFFTLPLVEALSKVSNQIISLMERVGKRISVFQGAVDFLLRPIELAMGYSTEAIDELKRENWLEAKESVEGVEEQLKAAFHRFRTAKLFFSFQGELNPVLKKCDLADLVDRILLANFTRRWKNERRIEFFASNSSSAMVEQRMAEIALVGMIEYSINFVETSGKPGVVKVAIGSTSMNPYVEIRIPATGMSSMEFNEIKKIIEHTKKYPPTRVESWQINLRVSSILVKEMGGNLEAIQDGSSLILTAYFKLS